MNTDFTRRKFVEAAGVAIVAGTATATASAQAMTKARAKTIRIIGVCCSPRKGKTTSSSLKVSLEAAADVDPNIEIELIELAGMNIGVFE